jgi:hypothetical protein
MAQPNVPKQLLENNFTAGFKTEFTGLNFPENAATSTQNTVYTLTGDVLRRGGINYETNFALNNINVNSVAHSSYTWKNVGGDGQTQVLVKQIGSTLYFFQITNATAASPISTTLLASHVLLTSFQATGNSDNVALTECQFTDGNGYLIVFHKSCDSFFCTFNPNNQTVTATLIGLQIRDFVGVPDMLAPSFRPTNTLTPEHQYNLQNQGWTAGTTWTSLIYNNGVLGDGTPTNPGAFPTGSYSVGSSITIPVLTQTNTTSLTNGSSILLNFYFAGGVNGTMTITVNSYVTPFTTITGIITAISISGTVSISYEGFAQVKVDNFTTHFDGQYITAQLANTGFITTWLTQIGNYPSNSDVWWLYKDTTNVFHPALTLPNVQQPFGLAPKGYYVLNAFTQQRSSLSGIPGITDIVTTQRPSTGCWFAGRVFYAGVNASQQATGDQPYTTWTENIYFSQIVETTTNFGQCYQTNDPTSQTLFSILPSDGGVITIQGCGAIYKLFALRFGLLVFAANGIWFIGGSSGIGFAADDYTVTKISSVQCTSGTSFIEVIGFPLFWNSEGIYKVTPSQQAGSAHSPDIQLDVQNMCIGTIKTFYNAIPQQSIIYARGDYDQINYIIQWMYRSTVESGISNRYSFDSAICFNTLTNAFYTYSLPTTSASTICDLRYIKLPSTPTSVPAIFKYITLDDGLGLTFSEENDFTRYVDFFSENSVGYNFVSSFISGYNLSGRGLTKFNPMYIQMYLRNTVNNHYKIQSVWDFGINRNSGRWSGIQRIDDNESTSNFGMVRRRHVIRGHGYILQIRVTSVDGSPFDIMGWGLWDEVNFGM